MQTLSIGVHCDVLHQLPHVGITVGWRIACRLHEHNQPQPFALEVHWSPDGLQEAWQGVEVVQMKRIVRITTDCGCDVEERYALLSGKDPVVLWGLFVEQSPEVVGLSGQWEITQVKIRAIK